MKSNVCCWEINTSTVSTVIESEKKKGGWGGVGGGVPTGGRRRCVPAAQHVLPDLTCSDAGAGCEISGQCCKQVARGEDLGFLIMYK
jgi:hypothetical protein